MFTKKLLQIKVTKGAATGRTLVLRDGSVTIGSGDLNVDLKLLGSRIQPLHLSIVTRDGTSNLENLATGATRIRKKGSLPENIVGQVKLDVGDLIQIGDTTVVEVSQSREVAKKSASSKDGSRSKRTIIYVAIGTLYIGGASYFFLKPKPATNATSNVWLSRMEVVECVDKTIDYAKENLFTAPNVDKSENSIQTLNVVLNPDALWYSLEEGKLASHDAEEMDQMLRTTLTSLLDQGEVRLQQEDWEGARAAFYRANLMLPVSADQFDEVDSEAATCRNLKLHILERSRIAKRNLSSEEEG